MIDSGAENVLAADWIAAAGGVDLNDPLAVVRVGIGGQISDVSFTEVELTLHHQEDPLKRVTWRAEVGFVPRWQAEFPIVLGQMGFIDQFTVTFSRTAATVAIEGREIFGERFEAS